MRPLLLSLTCGRSASLHYSALSRRQHVWPRRWTSSEAIGFEFHRYKAEVERLLVSVTDELADMRVAVTDELADMRKTIEIFQAVMETELARLRRQAAEAQRAAQRAQEAFGLRLLPSWSSRRDGSAVR